MTTVPQAEACFMILFASQSHPKWPRSSHTFAAALRAETNGNGEPTAVLEEHVVSWLPATLKIRPAALNPQTGRNLGLKETLDWALGQSRPSRVRITAWDPFQIEPSLLQALRERIGRLEEGSIEYIVLDRSHRPDRATHCVHALSDLGLTPNLLRTGGLYGTAASLRVLEYFKHLDLVIGAAPNPQWIKNHFGLDAYPIAYRPLR